MGYTVQARKGDISFVGFRDKIKDARELADHMITGGWVVDIHDDFTGLVVDPYDAEEIPETSEVPRWVMWLSGALLGAGVAAVIWLIVTLVTGLLS